MIGDALQIVHWTCLVWTLALSFAIHCDSHRHHKPKNGGEKDLTTITESKHDIARTNIKHGRKNYVDEKEPSFKRNLKRQNVTREKESELLVRKAEDILLDEIKGSDQAADRAEVAYNIPKENEYFDSSMKAGDTTDIDTANMIDYNEKKGSYLPILAESGLAKDDRKSKLTEQFENITGLPDFMLKHKDKSNVSLIDTVANALQPSTSAFTGIKQLLEETKVEQSLKKGLDDIPNFGHSISPGYRSLPAPLDKTAINSMPFSEGAPLSAGYTTPINSDQIFDEAVSPPEQLLDDLSAGRFKHPLSESVLNKMSNWNANKEYLLDNGYLNSHNPASHPRVSRISSEIMPVHDFYLKNKPVPPTEGISKDMYHSLGRDPEVLGRNQQFLNGNQYNSMSDLDSIGPPVYPARVIHMPHRHSTRIFLPTKHAYAHLHGPNLYEDVDEGTGHRWHSYGNRRHSHHFEENYEPGESEEYPMQPKVRNARCSYRPCFNGGKCTALIDKYVCTCREGFTGINCEKRSLCFPNPCRHGTCSSNPENFVCTCEVGWQGKRCEERDKCHPSPCLHGGTCSSTTSGVYCTCPPGYKGRYCESEAKCSPLNPCLNGGRCQEMPFTYMCICKNAFSGRNCEVVLNPTAIPPTIPFKPVPPQAIPVPHDQPPFLLEELNSLSYGPVQEHAVPEVKFDSSTTPEDLQHSMHGHHVESMHDHYHDEHYHDSRPRPISGAAALIIHTGDPSKEPKDKPKKDSKNAKKKKAPSDYTRDDRYQTHLVAAGPIKAKPANEEKNKNNSEHTKPPLETADQVKAKPTQKEENKPTQKEENKPKQLVPTAEILKRLQNPHPDENQVYTDVPKQLFSKEIGNLVSADSMNVKPIAKNKVSKGTKPKLKPVSLVKQKLFKPMQLPHRLNKPLQGLQSRGHQNHGKKTGKITAEIICPGFCKAFCDKWCTEVGCCRKIEIKGPTTASNVQYGGYPVANAKGMKKCLLCSDNADCIKGKCKCKQGFVGNGKKCDVNPCLLCHEHASCKSKSCECNIGYFGNGYSCTKFSDHCGRCSPHSDCISNFCLCKPGYYGNGNDCWPIAEPIL